MILSFEIPNPKDPQEIEIFFDDEGLKFLIEKLQKMLVQKSPAHDHFMTPEWGSGELSAKIEGIGNSKVHKITYGKKN